MNKQTKPLSTISKMIVPALLLQLGLGTTFAQANVMNEQCSLRAVDLNEKIKSVLAVALSAREQKIQADYEANIITREEAKSNLQIVRDLTQQVGGDAIIVGGTIILGVGTIAILNKLRDKKVKAARASKRATVAQANEFDKVMRDYMAVKASLVKMLSDKNTIVDNEDIENAMKKQDELHQLIKNKYEVFIKESDYARMVEIDSQLSAINEKIAVQKAAIEYNQKPHASSVLSDVKITTPELMKNETAVANAKIEKLELEAKSLLQKRTDLVGELATRSNIVDSAKKMLRDKKYKFTLALLAIGVLGNELLDYLSDDSSELALSDRQLDRASKIGFLNALVLAEPNGAICSLYQSQPATMAAYEKQAVQAYVTEVLIALNQKLKK